MVVAGRECLYVKEQTTFRGINKLRQRDLRGSARRVRGGGGAKEQSGSSTLLVTMFTGVWCLESYLCIPRVLRHLFHLRLHISLYSTFLRRCVIFSPSRALHFSRPPYSKVLRDSAIAFFVDRHPLETPDITKPLPPDSSAFAIPMH